MRLVRKPIPILNEIEPKAKIEFSRVDVVNSAKAENLAKTSRRHSLRLVRKPIPILNEIEPKAKIEFSGVDE